MRRIGAVLLAAALLGACGGEGDDPTVQSPTAEPTAEPTAAPTPCASEPPTDEPLSGPADLAQRPTVQGSDDPPPCDLVIRDLTVGEGAEAVVGSQVSFKYVGAFYESGEEFDASWDIAPDRTLDVQAGSGGLIQGFDQGLIGMREGGRRELVIPSDLGYGPQGQGPIPGDATLVFVIDLVRVAQP